MRRCSSSLLLSVIGFVAFSTVYLYMKGLDDERQPILKSSSPLIPPSQSVILTTADKLSEENDRRREFIKSMMKDAWDDYVKYAWGQNELRPVSQRGRSDDGMYGDAKIGATIIDSLDSLYIMGMADEYKAARDWTASHFHFKNFYSKISLFETNIRIVGGLLSAYALTKDKVFADLAIQVGEKLLPAFNTPSGIPSPRINPDNGDIEEGGTIVLAELGTLHLEFMYLSEISGNPIFAEKVLKIQKRMNELVKPNGLYITGVGTRSGKFSGSQVTMGGGSDSFYEYLLKAFVQNGDMTARKMYDDAIDAFISNDLIRVSKPSHLLYIASRRHGTIINDGSHLACFAGGMLALGSVTDPRDLKTSRRDRDMEMGKNLTNTCHESYIRTPTRIGPEDFVIGDGDEVKPTNPSYILRPEVIESYFVLYRTTGDQKYRDWGWDAAQAIQKHCKVGKGRGYSGIRNVNKLNSQKDDVQQTFFLAETLKYLYLLFSPPHVISLDQWVFNTEAHPLPIRGKNPFF